MGKTFTDLCNMAAKEIRWLVELAKSKYAESQAASQSATAVAASAAPDPNDNNDNKEKRSLKKIGNNKRANEIAQKFGYEGAEALKNDYVPKNGAKFNIMYDTSAREIILVSILNSSIQIATGLFI